MDDDVQFRSVSGRRLLSMVGYLLVRTARVALARALMRFSFVRLGRWVLPPKTPLQQLRDELTRPSVAALTPRSRR